MVEGDLYEGQYVQGLLCGFSRIIYCDGEYEYGWRRQGWQRHGFSIRYNVNHRVKSEGLYDQGWLKPDNAEFTFDKAGLEGKPLRHPESYTLSHPHQGKRKSVLNDLLAADRRKKRKRIAEEIINRGNRAYQDETFQEAEYHFSTAIQMLESDNFPSYKYYASRACCYLELEWFSDCIRDCEFVIKKDKNIINAYITKATAECWNYTLKEALKTVDAGLKIDLKNEELLELRKEIPKEIELGSKSRYYWVPEEDNGFIQE